MNRTAAETALEILRTLILHDGGKGSEDYDAAIIFEYRQKALDIIQRSCGQDIPKVTAHQFWSGNRWRFCPACQAKAFEFAQEYGNSVGGERSCGETAWVSVDTKLPEMGQSVLIWCVFDYAPYPQAEIAQRIPYGNGFAWNNEDTIPAVSVTHWQPLPSPPTGRTEEK